MKDRNPLIAFGLLATTVALKARTGQLRDADRLRLATAALEWVPDLPEARAAVLTFLHLTQSDPATAGLALQEVARGLVGDDLGRDPGEVLAQMPQTHAPDWMQRKDCGHG